jgi:tetratricopeptide (TPR) repeat protein
MNDLEIAPAPPTPEIVSLSRKRFGRRLLRLLSNPLGFARRRPWRAVFLLATILLFGSLIVLGSAFFFFQFHLGEARKAIEKRHNSEAIHHLSLCRRIVPEHREVLLLAARTARRAGAWDEAESMLDTYWRRFGDDEQLAFERHLHKATRGDLESTGLALQLRIQRGGADARLAREALVTGLIYRFRWHDARAVLDEWLAETPDDTSALLHLGKFQEQQLGHDRATQTYRRILELDSDLLEARLRLATILIAHRRGDEAATELAILREKLPNHPEVQLLWGQALALLGRTDEARIAIEDVLRANPDYPPALLEHGKNALFDGNEEIAERDLARAAKLDPGNIQAHNQFAFVLNRTGKQAQAAAEYAKAHQLETDAERIREIINGPLQANPNNPSLHHEIGVIALRSGLLSEALRWFNSSLQVDPDYLLTHQILANIYRELDNPALSAKHRAMAQKLSQQQKKN